MICLALLLEPAARQASPEATVAQPVESPRPSEHVTRAAISAEHTVVHPEVETVHYSPFSCLNCLKPVVSYACSSILPYPAASKLQGCDSCGSSNRQGSTSRSLRFRMPFRDIRVRVCKHEVIRPENGKSVDGWTSEPPPAFHFRETARHISDLTGGGFTAGRCGGLTSVTIYHQSFGLQSRCAADKHL